METTTQPSASIENEAFWQNHYQIQKNSGISRKAYCRRHKLNYDRFGYWIGKWNRDNREPLISVKLKTLTKIDPVPSAILCELNLKNGCILKIYDSNSLDIILSKYC